MKDQNDEPNSTMPKKLEDVKNYASVMYGAGAIAGGIATVNPFLVASGTISLFTGAISPYMTRNRDKFFNELKSDFEKLKSKVNGFDIGKALSNEKVLSAILYVYPIVVRTHQEDRLQLLRNAILNISLDIQIDEDIQHVFLQLVGELTPTHVKILAFFQNPKLWLDKAGINLKITIPDTRAKALEMAFPEIVGKYDQFVIDMCSRGLLPREGGTWIYAVTHDVLTPTIPAMGSQFLTFIKSPLD